MTDYPAWLGRVSDLLREPDPGETPWLVERLIVDRAICGVGGWVKTAKTWAMGEICISIVTGEPAFDGYELQVPAPGPVIFIIEESGRAALHRRLGALARGRGIDPDRLEDFHFAANQRIKMDDPGWLAELFAIGKELRPRAFVLDPLARMKEPQRNENAQNEYAIVIENIRLLRDETDAAVIFVQHYGKDGKTFRGTGDLESVWESRLGFERKNGGATTIKLEHREAETPDDVVFTLDYDHDERTMALRSAIEKPEELADRLVNWVAQAGEATTKEVAKGVERRLEIVARTLDTLKDAGMLCLTASDRLNSLGRRVPYKTWKVAVHPSLPGFDTASGSPEAVTTSDSDGVSGSHGIPHPPPKGVGGADAVPTPGDDDYTDWLWHTEAERTTEENLALLAEHNAAKGGEG